MDARWKHPFTCIVAGPTGCGKSTFVTRMLRHAAAMIDPPPEKITWCYGEWQEAYATTDLSHVRFEEGLPTDGHVRVDNEEPHRHRRSHGRNGRTGHDLVH